MKKRAIFLIVLIIIFGVGISFFMYLLNLVIQLSKLHKIFYISTIVRMR